MEITTELTGKVWKLTKSVGDQVTAGETLLILESMKMEIPIESPINGTLTEWLVQPEDMVVENQAVARIDSSAGD